MTRKMPVTNGIVLPDASSGITKVAVVDRYHNTGAGLENVLARGLDP